MFLIALCIVAIVVSVFLLDLANRIANKSAIPEEKFCSACGKEYKGKILCDGRLEAEVVHKDYDVRTGEERFCICGDRGYSDSFSCWFECVKCGNKATCRCFGLSFVTLYSRQLVNGKFVLESERCPVTRRRCCNKRVDNMVTLHAHSDDVPCLNWFPP